MEILLTVGLVLILWTGISIIYLMYNPYYPPKKDDSFLDLILSLPAMILAYFFVDMK